MARDIQLILNNKTTSFAFKKISRSDLYGSKKRIVLDNNNSPCIRTQIDEDTGEILPAGSYKSFYIDQEFNYIDKASLEVSDEDGNPLEKFESTLGKPQVLDKIEIQDFLNMEILSIYHLTSEDVDPELNQLLTNGELMKFSFNYYADFNLETGVLIKQNDNVFALIGNICQPDWVSESTAPPDSEDLSILDEDSLDFQMF